MVVGTLTGLKLRPHGEWCAWITVVKMENFQRTVDTLNCDSRSQFSGGVSAVGNHEAPPLIFLGPLGLHFLVMR